MRRFDARKLVTALFASAAIFAVPSIACAGSADTWSYSDFTNSAGINFADSSTASSGGAYQGLRVDDSGRTVLRIGESGAASDKNTVYHTNKVQVKGGFTTEFTFRFWNNQPAGQGADGIQFFIQKNTNKTAYKIYGPHNEFLGVKLDDYFNPGPISYDKGTNNVGIRTGDQDARTDGSRDVPIVVTTDGVINFRDGNEHSARIIYGGDAPGINQYKWNIYVDGIGVITDFTYDLATCESAQYGTLTAPCYDNNGDAWIGFSGSTGGQSQNQDIISWSYGPASAVPEPSSIAVLGMGLVGALGIIRRRRSM